jgi:hypothetical protein
VSRYVGTAHRRNNDENHMHGNSRADGSSKGEAQTLQNALDCTCKVDILLSLEYFDVG